MKQADFPKVSDGNIEYNERLYDILDSVPLCLNLWNNEYQNVMCNKMAVELFELDSKEQYTEEFFKLSPEYQPNGRLSAELALEHIKIAFEKGYCKFNWLHCKLNGDDIPAEVTLTLLDKVNDEDETLVAGFTRDLRPQMAGDETDEYFGNYFLNHISDKTLFNTIAQLSDEWFFAIDLRTSLVQYFGKGKEKLGFGSGKHRFPEQILADNVILQEDVELFEQFIMNIKAGIDKPLDIRFIPLDGRPRFFRFFYRIIFDAHQNPMFVIGRAIDVQEQKNFEIRSKTDLLTNCYNKITSESMIADAILSNRDNEHALFIIDIDNFKGINDNLGHHFGDMVLSEVANKLKNRFRNKDIIGRVGGDEFIVFVENINDVDIIKGKAEKVAEAFNNSYSGENNDYKISGSIGISRYPQDGTSFEELYKAADKALYKSKKRGKDCYTFYDLTLLDDDIRDRTTLENANRMVSSIYDAELVATVFNLLFETKDIISSINVVLQLVGKRLNVERSYIYETFDNGETYCNTFEWCKDGIVAEIDNLQNVPKETIKVFLDEANEEGLIYGNDLSVLKNKKSYELMKSKGIVSFLHAQVKDEDVVKLFLELDDCTNTRIWNEKDINSLSYIVKIISTFYCLSKN